jgi:hypothetical protein
MKYFILLLLAAFLLSGNVSGQAYVFHYNPYSGYNSDQLDLALKQSRKMKRNGIIASGVGTGMLVGGTLLMLDGLYTETEASFDVTAFGIGLGVMCLSGFPLGYGLVAWITGSEQIKQIEIELLASEKSNLKFKPTHDGFGLVYNF